MFLYQCIDKIFLLSNHHMRRALKINSDILEYFTKSLDNKCYICVCEVRGSSGNIVKGRSQFLFFNPLPNLDCDVE